MKRGFLPSLAVWRCITLRSRAAILLAVLYFAWPGCSLAFAQASRKLKTSVQPHYPDLARRNNVYGSARLEVLVARDGSIKEIKVLGGSPLLVQASLDAVKRWKYEPGPAETTVVVKFDFKP